MTVALIFPGQGSQHIGMGSELARNFPAARAVFNEVDDTIGEALSKVMWDGPEDALTLTQNAQPALMAVSIAMIRVLQSESGLDLERDVTFVAGHSLGEYSALCAAGAFTLAQVAGLLRIRGRVMQAAVSVGKGMMAAILGLDPEKVREIVTKSAQGRGVCQIANDNAPGQIVVSGHRAHVERAVALAHEYGARRVIELPVSAPFHCALMQPAAKAMAEALNAVEMRQPKVALVGNVTACAANEPCEIKRRLCEQVTATVRWRESVLYMVSKGIEHFFEIGAGRVLTGLTRRIAPKARAASFAKADDVAAFAKVMEQRSLATKCSLGHKELPLDV